VEGALIPYVAFLLDTELRGAKLAPYRFATIFGGALMKVLERGLLYVTFLSVLLAGIVLLASKVSLPLGQEVFVGSTDQGECFVSPPVAFTSSASSVWHPSQNEIEWTAVTPPGSNTSYKIEFADSILVAGTTVTVPPPPGVSSVQKIKPGTNPGDYRYYVYKDGDSAHCPLPTPAWVHISK
jgi:hypothetical protein